MLEIYPSIDLRAGQIVRLIQGDYARQIDYGNDPLAVAQSYEQAGATWLHMVDLDGAKTGAPANFPILAAVCRNTNLRVQFGGGMRDETQIRQAIDHGAARVVVGTRAVEDWPWFEALLRKPEMAGRITLGLDARDGQVAVRGWVESSGISAAELVRRAGDLPVGAIVYTDIRRDAMLGGPNFEATETLARATKIPVIASGGMSGLNDVERLMGTAVHGAIIGRALYEGRIDLTAAIRLVRGSHESSDSGIQ